MASNEFIKFLGTGGARVVVAKQLRSSAGTFIAMKGKNIILDPGPGTLVKCAKSRPVIDMCSIDAIILTHVHIDHSNDVNILIDGMTEGGRKKRGVLFATDECINGENSVVLKYLRSFLQDIVILEANKRYTLGDLTFSTSIRHQHSAETYGIIFELPDKKISFMVDTNYFPGLIESYRDSNILVVNTVRYIPLQKIGEIMHLCIDDVKKILSTIKPEKGILTHFGMTMLKAKPWEVANRLKEELGIEVIAASDGMTIEL